MKELHIHSRKILKWAQADLNLICMAHLFPLRHHLIFRNVLTKSENQIWALKNSFTLRHLSHCFSLSRNLLVGTLPVLWLFSQIQLTSPLTLLGLLSQSSHSILLRKKVTKNTLSVGTELKLSAPSFHSPQFGLWPQSCSVRQLRGSSFHHKLMLTLCYRFQLWDFSLI